jgi:putative SOS response-associated peptidase YedK
VCGRYYRRSEKQRIAEAFYVCRPTSLEILLFYNVAPQSFQPVIRLNEENSEREVAQMRWGLIPFWAKDANLHSTALSTCSR